MIDLHLSTFSKMDFPQCQANSNMPTSTYWYTLQTPQDLSTIKSSVYVGEGGPSYTAFLGRVVPKQVVKYESYDCLPVAPLSCDLLKLLEPRTGDKICDLYLTIVKHESRLNSSTSAQLQQLQEINMMGSHLHRSFGSFQNPGFMKPSWNNLGETEIGPIHVMKGVVPEYESSTIRDNDLENSWMYLHGGNPIYNNLAFEKDTSLVNTYTADAFFELSLSFSNETELLTNMGSEGYSKYLEISSPPKYAPIEESCPQIPVEEKNSLPVKRNSKMTRSKSSVKKKPVLKPPSAKEQKVPWKVKAQSLQDVTNYPFLAYNLGDLKSDKGKCSKRTYDIAPNPQITTEKNSKTRAHRCLICHKVFKRPLSYRIHYTIHSGEKQFRCSKCGKSFNVKSNLTRHEKLHGRPLESNQENTQITGSRQKRFVF